jgi:CheY-like chemotaxis protein
VDFNDDLPFPRPGERAPVVLVVEDEPLLRMSLTDHLKDCGFRVLEAGDALSAIETIKATPEIDVVFTDVKMPGGMDGFGLARWIRENRPELSVFVASGYTGKLKLADELCAGEQFFTKPYDLDYVSSKIQEALNARLRPKH